MLPRPTYSYRSSVKSDISDELINSYLLRPAAGLIVRVLYPTAATPNQVTVAAIVAGLLAALSYAQGLPSWNVVAGVLITLKDLLDSADGQLARAKEMYSRTGRFLDSLGDILVNALVFIAITVVLVQIHGDPSWIFLGAAGFLGITLRVSYHVFYQTSFLHCQRMYAVNRTTEEIREEDLDGSGTALTLQRLFLILYGWQDSGMVRLDRLCRGGIVLKEGDDQRWYTDRSGLRLSGFLGMGTELFVLTVFSVANRLEWYFFVNVVGLNGLWVASIMYRRFVLRQSLGRAA